MKLVKSVSLFILKYSTLLFLFWILLLLTKSYGNDYGSGVILIFILPLIFIFIVINIIVLYIFDKKYKKFKTTNRLLIILGLILCLHLLLGYINNNKESKYNLILKNDDGRIHEIKLFENNQYRIKKQYAEGSSYHTGKYVLENNILELKDSIEKISNDEITTKYNYVPAKKCFIPLNKNFDTLIIENK